MDDATAVSAVLVPPALQRFREVCEVTGPIEPRFDGFTKHVLLTHDRAFLFPRNHTIVRQLERETLVYGAVDHPLVPRLLGSWRDLGISPYPFFAVSRLPGRPSDDLSSDDLPRLATQLGAALAAGHDLTLDQVPQRLWTNAWKESRAALPTASDCHSPLRVVGGAEHLADTVAPFVGSASRSTVLDALRAAEAMEPVLAHGDLHEGHLLLDESGALTGILDWGFGGVMSPLVDFTCSQWGVSSWASERVYGDLRRTLWGAYAEQRSAPLPSWEEISLALTVFDVVALDPKLRSHYFWQKTPEWRVTRQTEAREFLRAALA